MSMLCAKCSGVLIGQMCWLAHLMICLVECKYVFLRHRHDADRLFAAGARSQYPGAVTCYGSMMFIPSLLLAAVGPCTTKAYLPAVAGIVERVCGECK